MTPPSLSEWSPVVDASTRDRVLRAVQEVAGTIRSQFPPQALDPTLGAGAAGQALLFSQLGRVLGVERYEEEAQRYRKRALEALSTQALPLGLVDGVAGICAVDAFLDPSGADRSHQEIENSIERALGRITRDVGLELARGLLGCGVYALERLPSAAARRCVRSTMDILEREATTDEHGSFWLQLPPPRCGDWRRDYPSGYVHFGLTHGTAAIVAFLASCVATGADARAASLLGDAVRWILAHEREADSDFRFPTLLAADGRRKPGWIYGDLAIASSVMLAAEALDQPSWREEAMQIAKALPLGARAVDAVSSHALCHGVAGIAHMMHRMAQRSKDEDLIDSARGWLERCLAMRSAGHGIAGFLAATDPPRNGGNPSSRPGNPGLLLGAAGTALVLLAFVSDVPPTWDRLLLFSN